MAIISLKDITKSYQMGPETIFALNGIDLTIEPGEFTAIVGTSGSGKSTLMNIIGLLDKPSGGNVFIDDKDVVGLHDDEISSIRNQKIGFVFQTFNLLAKSSALKNVELPLYYASLRDRTLTPEKITAMAKASMEMVSLGDRMHHRPNELSGGQRQRVAIARALVNNPSLILADEPTGSLDSRTGEDIMRLFHELNEQGVTIILVTHDQDLARETKRIVRVTNGKVKEEK
jgi:putative ABC transport system ATP-binding protein